MTTTLRAAYLDHQGKISDKWARYIQEYDRLLLPWKDQAVRLLEIGVQNGGSLEIFARYFGSASKIIGCDIDDKCSQLNFLDQRIHIVIGDANTPNAFKGIEALSSEFDIVIDDGSHRSSDIIRSFANYFPKLSEAGIYIVEDLHCSYWREFEGELFGRYSAMTFLKRLADSVNSQHWANGLPPSAIFRDVLSHYAVDISDDSLASIHSVEFLNSMCIIRKEHQKNNQLTERVIAGNDASVVKELAMLRPEEESFSYLLTKRPPERAKSIVVPEDALDYQADLVQALRTEVDRHEKNAEQLLKAAEIQADKLSSLDKHILEQNDGIKTLRFDLATQAVQLLEAQAAVLRHHRESQQEIATLRLEIGADIADLTRQMQAKYEEKQAVISELLASNSWKITAPLRRLSKVIRAAKTSLGRRKRRLLLFVEITKAFRPALKRWGSRGLIVRIIGHLRNDGLVAVLRKGVHWHRLTIQQRLMMAPIRPAPPPTSANRSARIDEALPRLLYVVNRHDIMTQHYRVYNYAEVLPAHGFDVKVVHDDELDESDFGASLLILNRVVWSEPVSRLIKQFKDNSRPVVFDIDDFLFDTDYISSLKASHFHTKASEGEFTGLAAALRQTMLACDYVTTSTFPLLLEAEKIGCKGFVLPNSIGWAALQIAATNKDRRQKHGSVTIGYFSGTNTHNIDFLQCAGALATILERFTEVNLTIVGYLTLPAVLEPHKQRISVKDFMSHTQMLETLSKIDINLAPLEFTNRFANCKSELKVFEAALFSIPTVATPTHPFSTAINHGVSGFLADTEASWCSSLESLIVNADLRRQIGSAAHRDIAGRFSIHTLVREAASIYHAALMRELRDRANLVEKTSDTISIVSILYKKAGEIRFFLKSLFRQDFPGMIEIILVDDCSPDDSSIVATNYLTWASKSLAFNQKIGLRIIKNDVNFGNCQSRNIGIQHATGEVIIIVDADCVFNRSFLSHHWAAHKYGTADVAIGPINIETNGVSPLSVLAQYEASQNRSSADNCPQDSINLDSFVNCITRNFSISRAYAQSRFGSTVFDEAFSYSADPNSGFGWEDVELGYRLYEAGARIQYLPETVSIHVSHAPTGATETKPLRSLRNFRRLVEKHPELALVSRSWACSTFSAIASWAHGSNFELESNSDYIWLRNRFDTLPTAPALRRPDRRLKILTYRWHCPHQYELYRSGHEFTLVTGTGTWLCETWDFNKRPIPSNARFQNCQDIKPNEFDLAILHFDENVLHPELCNGKVPQDWGQTFKWLLGLRDLPKVAICHGTPQFFGQYDRAYSKPDLGNVIEANRKELVDKLFGVKIVCNSHQAAFEWNFHKSETIWHGFAPHEFPPTLKDKNVLVMLEAAMRNRPHYNGLFVFEAIERLLGSDVKVEHQSEDQFKVDSSRPQESALCRYQNYVRQLGRYRIYLNPTVRSPMPRARGEAMMAGAVPVSLRNHDVDLFIKNGVNGFFGDTPEELAEQLVWLSKNEGAAEKMGALARQVAFNLFNQDRYLDSWSKLLQSMT